VSDTPKTDELAKREFVADGVWIRHARELERENAELRERLHIADAEIDMWASRCASAIWLLPETVTGGQLRDAQDKFHRMLHAARKEAQP
jgi:hypothetical protein